MPEGKIKHVADDESLRNVLRGERALTFQIVPVLHAANAAGRTAFQPGSKSIRIRHQLGVGIGDKHRATTLEPSRDGRLQRVVVAAAATESVEVESGILRKWPVELALFEVCRAQCAREVLAERIVRNSDRLGDSGQLQRVCVKLALSLRDEAVMDLVNVGVELLQMHPVGSGVCNVHEETGRQFALNVQVVLLQISVFLNGIAGCRKVVLSQNVLRHIRLRVAPRDRYQGACTILVERSLPGTGEICSTTGCGQRASVLIQGGTGSQPTIVAGEER